MQTKSSIKDFVSLVSLQDKGYTVPQTYHPQHSVVLSTATGLWARKVHVGRVCKRKWKMQADTYTIQYTPTPTHLVHGGTLSEHRSEGREVGDDGLIEVDTAVMEVSAHLVGEGRREEWREEWREEGGVEGGVEGGGRSGGRSGGRREEWREEWREEGGVEGGVEGGGRSGGRRRERLS